MIRERYPQNNARTLMTRIAKNDAFAARTDGAIDKLKGNQRRH
jgi:hypothetical protein